MSPGVPYLAHLTLLNVDVTDAVMQQLARQCPLLQHLAIGRTENNAFGNFVSDAGLRELATACPRLDSLCLFRCYSCSDAGLEQLTANCHLTNLVLHSCPQVKQVPQGVVGFGNRQLILKQQAACPLATSYCKRPWVMQELAETAFSLLKSAARANSAISSLVNVTL